MTYEELQVLCQRQYAELSRQQAQLHQQQIQLQDQQTRLQQQTVHIEELSDTIKVLKELLNRNSNNSSSPPSLSRGYKRKDKKGRINKMRKKRLVNKGLRRFPHERVSRFHDHRPEKCSSCGSFDLTNGFIKSSHQTVDIPPITPIIEEHRRWCCRCRDCGNDSLGKFPNHLSRKTYGPNIRTWIVLLATKGNVTIRKAIAILQELLGAEISLGTSINIANHFSRVVEAPYQHLMDEVKVSDLCYADETGWYERNKKCWLWQCATPKVVGFMVALRRNAQAARNLLGDLRDRILVTDRWEPYDRVAGQRQYCFAHLIRNFRAVEERGREDGILGGLLRAAVQSLCHERTLWKVGELSWDVFMAKVDKIKQALRETLTIGQQTAFCAKTKRLCTRLLKEFDHLWVFTRDQRVELTNNESERNLRAVVLKRKVSLGSQSASGSDFIARAYSIMATLAKRGFSFAQYVRNLFTTVMAGGIAPPLPV